MPCNRHFLIGGSLFVLLRFLQNDDEDMIYVYNAYLHKMITCFLSHPIARDKVS
ncbi:Nuclear pore complex protein NUP205 [Vitis vinifera]|uniref:Nuclear pore complex protein NUP205 n=1 Tax=Vitis vinifera TaxID=29760 RepID=A0A438JPT7_VITVI|nr:Nuclear pore complex protein NUP205 [Vitis vinifera]